LITNGGFREKHEEVIMGCFNELTLERLNKGSHKTQPG
jgi:hypothetical protein